jgi:SAM-dependent methyltransferase
MKTLPPPKLRWGGLRLKDDRAYVNSATILATNVQRLAGLTPEAHLLDVGCGPGRLLIGLDLVAPVARYVGVDTHQDVVAWAARHLGGPGVEFHLALLFNERYNTSGRRPEQPGFLPFEDGEFDAACLHSVFSHMRVPDIALYLTELSRLLPQGGRAYATAFVEDGVPDETENPSDYGGPWSGPLHCVRLNRALFERLVADAGLAVDGFEYRPHRQSRYGLVKP